MSEEIKKNEIYEAELEKVTGGIDPDIVLNPEVVYGNELSIVGEESDMDRHADWDNPFSPVYIDPNVARAMATER